MKQAQQTAPSQPSNAPSHDHLAHGLDNRGGNPGRGDSTVDQGAAAYRKAKTQNPEGWSMGEEPAGVSGGEPRSVEGAQPPVSGGGRRLEGAEPPSGETVLPAHVGPHDDRPIGPGGTIVTLGNIVVTDVVRLDATDAEVETQPGSFAVDVRVVESAAYRLVRVGDQLQLVPTGETAPLVATRFMPLRRLPPPTLEDAARERLAQALADVITADEEMA